MKVYCEDNRCQYWRRGRCKAKVLLMRSVAPSSLYTDCEDCQFCVPFENEEEMREYQQKLYEEVKE